MKENMMECVGLVQADNWSVTIDGTENGQNAKKKYAVGAFALINGVDGRKRLMPMVFSEDCEGMTLAELEGELESSGFSVKGSHLFCGGSRAVEKGRV